jgi:hypothetical protein
MSKNAPLENFISDAAPVLRQLGIEFVSILPSEIGKEENSVSELLLFLRKGSNILTISSDNVELPKNSGLFLGMISAFEFSDITVQSFKTETTSGLCLAYSGGEAFDLEESVANHPATKFCRLVLDQIFGMIFKPFDVRHDFDRANKKYRVYVMLNEKEMRKLKRAFA